MRRALLSSALSLVWLAVAAPFAGGVPTPPPRASLAGFLCERASNSLDRAVGVTGVMRPVTGTQGLEMKFVLVRRSGTTGPFTPVQGGDLGRWITPKPATLGQRPTDVWRLKKLVVNLAAPFAYRFRVTFHWLGANDAVLSHTTLLSAVCDQPR